MQGLRIVAADVNIGSANDLEKEQDDAVVDLKSDGFKDDEINVPNEGHKCAIKSTDSGCSKGHLSSDAGKSRTRMFN